MVGWQLRGTCAPHLSQSFIMRGGLRMIWAQMSWPPHSQVATAWRSAS